MQHNLACWLFHQAVPLSEFVMDNRNQAKALEKVNSALDAKD